MAFPGVLSPGTAREETPWTVPRLLLAPELVCGGEKPEEPGTGCATTSCFSCAFCAGDTSCSQPREGGEVREAHPRCSQGRAGRGLLRERCLHQAVLLTPGCSPALPRL